MGEICFGCFASLNRAGVCPHCGYDPSEDIGKYPAALSAGTILNGKYILGRVLGQGGFGITYAAQDFSTKQRVAIKEFGDNIIFLHRIVPGKAEKSFGVQVAKLAGLPKCVIERSQRILHELEESDISQKHRNVSMTSEFSQPDKESEIVEKLRGINVNELTPLEAMLTLSELITMARSEV